MEGRERAVTMSPANPFPSVRVPARKTEGFQGTTLYGSAIVQRNVGHWEGRKRGFRRTPALSTARTSERRCSGVDLTREKTCLRKKKNPDIWQFLFLQDIDNLWLCTISITSTSIYIPWSDRNGLELMTNFLVHPCLHKIIVQPLAVFRQSPSPFTSVWRDEALSSYPRQARHKDDSRKLA